MTAPRDLPFWHDLSALDEPVPDVAADQRARTDQALARLRASEQRIDRQLCDQWLDSGAARDYLPTAEED